MGVLSGTATSPTSCYPNSYPSQLPSNMPASPMLLLWRIMHPRMRQQEVHFDVADVQRMIWPGNSPDLNMIEICWAYLKRITTKKGSVDPLTLSVTVAARRPRRGQNAPRDGAVHKRGRPHRPPKFKVRFAPVVMGCAPSSVGFVVSGLCGLCRWCVVSSVRCDSYIE